MSDRTQRLIAEVGRFLVVGGAATIVALIIFNLLVHGFNTGDHALLKDEPILAFVMANSVGMGVSYYGSRHWAFRDRPPVTSDGISAPTNADGSRPPRTSMSTSQPAVVDLP